MTSGTAETATNQDRLDRRRNYAGPAFLREGFRPMFLAAGLWAALAAPLWVAVWSGLIAWRGGFEPLAWHVHEMIFGFVAAAMGGFLLTAVPNWTGRLPVRGAPLAGLAALWLAGRIAMWVAGDIGPVAAFIADFAYLAALGTCIAGEIVAGRNWRNLPVMAGVAILAGANVLFHLPSLAGIDTGALAVRLSVSTVAMMVALIGGRIVPSFTRNWLAKRGGPEIAGPMGHFDLVVLAGMLAALLGWTAAGAHPVVGAGLVAAGLLNLARLARWGGWRTGAEPLVAILHVAYFWLGAGLLMLGLSMTGNVVSPTAALHVLTVGAMATMILAVMTRAILGHTGKELRAGRGTIAIYVLATLAVAGRVVAEIVPGTGLLWLTAAAWSAAFALFVAIYGPPVLRRR